jgi:leucyl/phenylalanyl-tRNA--protein transferase
MVLRVAEFRVSRSLRKRIERRTYDVRSDTAFDAVIGACAAAPRAGQYGTWITTAMIDAYLRLHDAGHAHSIEAWQDGVLVGGLYGLCLGGVFFGESMFAHASDASKVALAALVGLLRARGASLIDCQQETSHLASLGARPIPRAAFARELDTLIHSYAATAAWPRGPLEDPS